MISSISGVLNNMDGISNSEAGDNSNAGVVEVGLEPAIPEIPTSDDNPRQVLTQMAGQEQVSPLSPEKQPSETPPLVDQIKRLENQAFQEVYGIATDLEAWVMTQPKEQWDPAFLDPAKRPIYGYTYQDEEGTSHRLDVAALAGGGRAEDGRVEYRTTVIRERDAQDEVSAETHVFYSAPEARPFYYNIAHTTNPGLVNRDIFETDKYENRFGTFRREARAIGPNKSYYAKESAADGKVDLLGKGRELVSNLQKSIPLPAPEQQIK